MEFPRKARLGEAARNGESPPVREGFVRSGAQPSIGDNVRRGCGGVKGAAFSRKRETEMPPTVFTAQQG
jgi:hypothetical protein